MSSRENNFGNSVFDYASINYLDYNFGDNSTVLPQYDNNLDKNWNLSFLWDNRNNQPINSFENKSFQFAPLNDNASEQIPQSGEATKEKLNGIEQQKIKRKSKKRALMPWKIKTIKKEQNLKIDENTPITEYNSISNLARDLINNITQAIKDIPNPIEIIQIKIEKESKKRTIDLVSPNSLVEKTNSDLDPNKAIAKKKIKLSDNIETIKKIYEENFSNQKYENKKKLSDALFSIFKQQFPSFTNEKYFYRTFIKGGDLEEWASEKISQ